MIQKKVNIKTNDHEAKKFLIFLFFCFVVIFFSESNFNLNHRAISSAEGATQSLIYREWELISIDGEPIPHGFPLPMTLKIMKYELSANEFQYGVTGTDGCNWLGGLVEFDEENNQMTVSEFSTTLRSCAEDVIDPTEWSRRYAKRLEITNTITVNIQTLVLQSSIGRLEFKATDYAELKGSLWALESLTEREHDSVLDEAIFKEDYLTRPFVKTASHRPHASFREMYLEVNRGEISGFAGCNDFEGTITASIKETSINVSTTTDNECSEEYMIREKEFLAMFEHVILFTFTISKDKLTFTNSDGTRIAIFSAQSNLTDKAYLPLIQEN